MICDIVRFNMRVGFGYDVHPLSEDRKLILGGVRIPYNLGLIGHSDADVLCHAIGDAILGACNLGDIGKRFPDTKSKYKNISSIKLLREIRKLINKRFWIEHVDSTILIEEPKISQFFNKMREKICGALGIENFRFSVKATRNEGLGFIGRNEGIAAFAVVLVRERIVV